MRFFLVTILGISLAFPAWADAYLTTNGRTTQPVGHYEFCKADPAECQVASPQREPLSLTRALWAKIVEVNNLVNTMVIPRTDREMWNLEEVWSYPTEGFGDCEDYVLEKRKLLNKAGIPLSHLLITVVRQKNGDGHAVLTIRTHLGDFVLDNLEPRVLVWSETSYEFLKQQSSRHTGVWVAIEDNREVLTAKK